MPSIAAAWGTDWNLAWDRLLSDQYPSCDAGLCCAQWQDATTPVQVGRVEPRPDQRREATTRIEPTSNCIVVVEGRVETARDAAHDSEVVAAAYRRWGRDFVAHLHGDFSFILWDRNTRHLLAGGDVLGGHSLAYFFDGRTLLIASRVLSLLRHPNVGRQWNALYFSHVMSGFWAQEPGLTAFQDIRRVRAGFVIELAGGRLSEHRAASLQNRPLSLKSLGQAREEFWGRLRSASRARFDSSSATCLALSGGLDSTSVGAALADETPTLAGFTLLSSSRKDLNETAAVKAFCALHPFVRWQGVVFDSDDFRGESDRTLLLADDPRLAADAFRSARIHLMRELRRHGFRSVLDGEGGDELFSMSRRLGDFVRMRRWARLATTLATNPRPRSMIWRGLVVPHLPLLARALWSRRESRRTHATPPWMTRAFWRSEVAKRARAEMHEWSAIDCSAKALQRILENPANRGARQAARLDAAQNGMESRSPFLDRSIIEFALGLPPELHWNSPRTKPFLRSAGVGRLPAEILERDKDIGLYEFLLHGHFHGKDKEGLLPMLSSHEPFIGMIDTQLLEDSLRQAQHRAAALRFHSEDLYSLLACARWVRDVAAEYGP